MIQLLRTAVSTSYGIILVDPIFFTNFVSTIYILFSGANPDAADGSGSTALLIALRESSHVTVDCLLKHGCDVSVTDKLGHSALYIAIHSTCNKSLDLAKTLLGSGRLTYSVNFYLV